MEYLFFASWLYNFFLHLDSANWAIIGFSIESKTWYVSLSDIY